MSGNRHGYEHNDDLVGLPVPWHGVDDLLVVRYYRPSARAVGAQGRGEKMRFLASSRLEGASRRAAAAARGKRAGGRRRRRAAAPSLCRTMGSRPEPVHDA